MKIEQLAAWGEFLGGIAVVAGLVFVGLQLMSANREAQLAANRSYAEFFNTLGSMLTGSSEIADIWYRGYRD